MKLPIRRGVPVEDEDSTGVADSEGDADEARTLRPPRVHRVSPSIRAGQKVLAPRGSAAPGFAAPRQTGATRKVRLDGLSSIGMP